MAYDMHIAHNKHGFLVTAKQVGHDIEEQKVYRTVDDLMRSLRDTSIDTEKQTEIRRHLEDGKPFSMHNAELPHADVTHIFGSGRPGSE